MTNLDQLVNRYVSVWNQPPTDERRASIRDLWSEQADLFNRLREYHGHPGIEQAVQRSYELFVSRGFRFRPRETPASHHNAIRFA